MAKNSKIEWTNHTFNPWWGCVKVSDACKNCYAEAWAKRVGSKVWGPKAPRRFFSENHWKEPIKWNTEAADSGERRRVFCASMADVFEDRDDLIEARNTLWELIEKTPSLDWLLLTKRPENVNHFAPWKNEWPTNVWLGTTLEHQKVVEERMAALTDNGALIRFVSAEPLLGPLDLSKWLGTQLHWVITGGESGPKARPTSPSWFRDLLAQCREKDVPFHFKQWGDWAPNQSRERLVAKKSSEAEDGTQMVRIGKKAAGRILDGSTWDGLPEIVAA